jgi:hypothetical protein
MKEKRVTVIMGFLLALWMRSTVISWGLTNEADRRKADGAQATPARRSG